MRHPRIAGWVIDLLGRRGARESYFCSLAASILLFEVGMLPLPGIEATDSVLARPGAAELLASPIERGLQCKGDVVVNHEEYLALPLTEVRETFGIPEPQPGSHMFIV